MKIFILVIASLALISCSQEKQSESTPVVKTLEGTREFQVNNSQSAFTISLSGVVMGTPDRDLVWEIIENAQNEGVVDELVELIQPTEGGLNHCLVIQDKAARIKVLQKLQDVRTSIQDSNYAVRSIERCH